MRWTSGGEDRFVVHVDPDLIVVDKPPGLPSVPGRVAELKDSAISRIQTLFSDALVVHRLDMATSGLLLFARGPTMQRALSKLFEQRLIEKQYEAIVSGVPSAPAGTITLPLAADWPNRPRQKVDWALGKPATTHWTVLSPASSSSQPDAAGLTSCTRLALSPVTGRSHQLRVHLSAIGHPILGDPLYADADQQGLATRLLLHASQLAFDHPARQERLQFRSVVPF
jgi:tRNA pseudouridine32 synthase / 23S rRNA pseudouridine746 synthase